MVRVPFPFAGGDKLKSIGAAWFVSYCYYDHIDKTHKNWDCVSTAKTRISTYKNSVTFHKDWLKEILNMNESGLGKNVLGLSGADIKRMATDLLPVV